MPEQAPFTPRHKRISAWASVALATLLLLSPALLAGRPFVFFDTPTFYDWGADIVAAIVKPWPDPSALPIERGLRTAAEAFPGSDERVTPQSYQLILTIVGARSEFYAAPFYLLTSTLTMWAPAALQALALACLLWTAANVLWTRMSSIAFLALVALLAFGTSAGIFAAFMMPDVFGAIAVLAAALLLCCRDRLTAGQRTISAALLLIALLVHLSNPLVVSALLVCAVAFSWVLQLPKRRNSAPLVVLGAICLAVIATAGSRAGLAAVFHHPIRTPPFLEGRVIADGPGQRYLQAVCAEHRYEACRFKDLRIAVLDDIIWVGDHGTIPLINDPEARRRFLDEQFAVVIGTLTRYPLEQLWASIRNSLVQLRMVHVGGNMGTSFSGLLNENSYRTRTLLETTPGVSACLADAGRGCDYVSARRNALHGAVLLVSAVVLILAFGIGLGRRNGPAHPSQERLAAFALVVVSAILANAVICGSLSGPFDRYEARMIWLIPFLAGLFAWELVEHRSRAQFHRSRPQSRRA